MPVGAISGAGRKRSREPGGRSARCRDPESRVGRLRGFADLMYHYYMSTVGAVRPSQQDVADPPAPARTGIRGIRAGMVFKITGVLRELTPFRR